MIAIVQGKEFDLSTGFDVSLPITTDPSATKAWYVDPPVMEPVRLGSWVGSVAEGGSVNFRSVVFNPHGHGTHTETVGHIAPKLYSINRYLTSWFFLCQLVTIEPVEEGEDLVLPKAAFEHLPNGTVEAIAIRTLPNEPSKKTKNYSNANPPYLSAEAALMLREKGIKHLLIDLPSVDKEVDGGELKAHKAFWNYPAKPRLDATITELIYVSGEIADGEYLLNLQVAAFENDASPSRPVLHPLKKKH